MEKFVRMNAVAAPFPSPNIDTDQIAPKELLKIIRREGLGARLFDNLRYTGDGSARASFVLNKPAYRDAKILVTGANFGCGSSREHAVWALYDYGIRCVIAPSFGDIFRTNCAKNGLLAATLPASQCDEIQDYVQAVSRPHLDVDLESRRIKTPHAEYDFEVDAYARMLLLNGFDEIDIALMAEGEIRQYEAARHRLEPWFIPDNQ